MRWAFSTHLIRLRRILSFPFRLSQGASDILPLQGRLQSTGFAPFLHVRLRLFSNAESRKQRVVFPLLLTAYRLPLTTFHPPSLFD